MKKKFRNVEYTIHHMKVMSLVVWRLVQAKSLEVRGLSAFERGEDLLCLSSVNRQKSR